ncbi:MAG: polysaccharide biosynthesis/export family protein [Roseovarius sp.]|nr:polysaccharide biosynthesis/export family protein [Roseovarius sp.]
MRKTSRAVVVLGLAVMLAGCSLPRSAALQSEIVNEANREEPTIQVVPVTREMTPMLADWPATGWDGYYRWFGNGRGPDSSIIRTGDELDIVIWDNQENSLLSSGGSKSTPIPATVVSSSGNVFIPYVGDVAVRGMTADAARERLQKKLEGIAPTAQVQLAVKPGRNNSIDMVAGVGSPGRYPLENRNTKILGVIAQAGGIIPALRHPLVRLQRGTESYETRAERLMADPARNVRVRGGDQIIVTEDDRTFNVLGAAGTQEVMNFRKESMSAMEALSAMGGLQGSRADPKGILVLREYEAEDLKPGTDGPDMQQVVFTMDLTSADGLFAARQFEINPDDTLLATESPISAARTIVGLFGTVIGVTSSANNL